MARPGKRLLEHFMIPQQLRTSAEEGPHLQLADIGKQFVCSKRVGVQGEAKRIHI